MTKENKSYIMFFMFNIFKKKVEQKIEGGEKFTLKSLDAIAKNQAKTADREFKNGYDMVMKYPKSVSILGSAILKPDNEWYKKAESLARRIVTELKYAVVTGGGPGIMEAANKGAYEAGGDSIGYAIKLPNEQYQNKFLTDSVTFNYFFTRKTMIFCSAEAYVYFPGGFGTMDELFEILTLIKTDKMPQAPVILVGKDFWQPLLNFIENELYEDYKVISKDFMEIYKIVDSEDEIIDIIRKAPLRTDY
jgi:uncharacterized protein (TIGR00730 family)